MRIAQIKKWFAFVFILFSKSTFAQLPDSVAGNIKIIKKYVFEDYKQMFKKPEGALLFPYITPGSRSYSNVLWDWDSWLSNIAMRQILQDQGTAADKSEAVAYEQGCVLNYLAYTDSSDGYMPIAIDKNSDPAKIKPADIYSTNMHKPVIAQHAVFLPNLMMAMQNGCVKNSTVCRHLFTIIKRITATKKQDSSFGKMTWQSE